MQTLRRYIGRDLAKVTVMAAIAFTLLMTVLGIIEPMRKQGLGAGQAVTLFALTLPVMLSLSLPIAALFAATIVYGRFSQDNEITACRASGVSTIDLLKPALILGVIVTFLALVLSNLVAPILASHAGKIILADAEGFVFNRLDRKATLERERFILRAEDADLESKQLVGAVVIIPPDFKKANELATEAKRAGRRANKLKADLAREQRRARPDPAVMAQLKADALSAERDAQQAETKAHQEQHRVGFGSAAQAYVEDISEAANGKINLNVDLEEPVANDVIKYRYTGKSTALAFQIDNPVKEKLRWYTWGKLLGILRQPTQHGEIHSELSEIQQTITQEKLGKELMAAFNVGLPYEALSDGDVSYRIHAPRATLESASEVSLSGTADAGGRSKVVVEVIKDGQAIRRITGRRGRVEAGFSLAQNRSIVTITVTDGVYVYLLDEPGRQFERPTEWKQGEIPLPAGIRQEQTPDAERLRRLCDHPESSTDDPELISRVRDLRDLRIPKLMAGIIAEMHERVAYGASCFMMVAMGAALGLIFRGGQVAVAFVLTLVPAAIVITMVLMGKELVRNPEVAMQLG
ncbi:MAG: LptF/LptG family permease, partial [Planctomycetota bacterium]